MTSTQILRDPIDQENGPRLIRKESRIGEVKRALGDRSNTLQNPNNHGKVALKSNINVHKPVALKKPEVVKKSLACPQDAKENIGVSRPAARRPIRQESIVQKPKEVKSEKKSGELENKASTIYDPDENSKDDPQMVTEYVADIVSYLKKIEEEFPIQPNYLKGSEITSKMRVTLTSWLIDAHENFSMTVETLHLCISIVDRYMQVDKSVTRGTYQLVGTAALLLAAKYEEIYFPSVSEFAYICDNAYTVKQIFQMEKNIFQALDYRMGWPVSIFFLRRYSKIAKSTSLQHNLAKYILELALLDHNMISVKPSIQAAAACCLSIALMLETMVPLKVWTPTLIYYTKYKYSDFKDVLHSFADLLVKADTPHFESVKKKYAAPTHGRISVSCKLKGPLLRKLTKS